MIDFKGSQFEKEIILWAVRWYVAYPISYRQLEEMMGERGVAVDPSTLNRWVIKSTPEFEKQFRRRQRPVGRSWRLDEPYVKIRCTIAGIEVMPAIRKGQLTRASEMGRTPAEQFYSLAA